jgi:uncharacterized protein (TIRG00374 family)
MEPLMLALCLMGIAGNHAFGFFLAARDISPSAAARMSFAALGLNKIFFTGTGYVLTAYFGRGRTMAGPKAMAIFIVLEAVFFSVWIGCGLYYGGRLLIDRAPYGLLAAGALIAAAAIVKRDKVLQLFRELPSRCAEMGSRLFAVVPLAIVNVALSLLYYQALFACFGHVASMDSVLKTASIAISAGYLSPAPGGLGFKDAGLAALLMEQGVPAGSAVAIAFWDRVITTAFWALLGVVFAFDTVREEVGSRIRRRRK